MNPIHQVKNKWTKASVASVLCGLAASAVLTFPATAEVLNDPTVDQLVGALQVREDAPTAKAFRRTLPPDSKNLCPEGQTVSTGNSKNIVIVAYQFQPSARVDLPLQFGNDSDALQASDRRTLDNLAQAMNSPELQVARFALAGHTSTTGSQARNDELSCARSLAIRRYLVQRGVASERLTAYGFGPSRNLPGIAGEDALNRRVEINRE